MTAFVSVSESARSLSVTGAYGKTKPVMRGIWERQARCATPAAPMVAIYFAGTVTAAWSTGTTGNHTALAAGPPRCSVTVATL